MYSINKQNVENNEFTFIEVNQKDIKVTFMDYGATILSILVPDKDGIMESVVMAYDKLNSYIDNNMYLNATIGPNSGRIENANYIINNEDIQVEKNFQNSENLHSGSDCFAFKIFDFEVFDSPGSTKVVFKYEKNENDSVFPGNQIIKIIYTVSSTNLLIEFEGETDKDALLNMTNHTYFNLSGNMKNRILDHKLQVNSKQYMELNKNFVPFIISSSSKTIYNFFNGKKLSESLNEAVYDLPTLGIDHPFIFEDVGFNYKQISLKDPISKRELEVYTTYPCAVIYTHNYLEPIKLLFDVEHVRHLGICLETQNEPNGINIKGLNDSVLRSDIKYYHKTLYKFKVGK